MKSSAFFYTYSQHRHRVSALTFSQGDRARARRSRVAAD